MRLHLPAPRASRPWCAFKIAGDGNSSAHIGDVSRKINLNCDRRDSQLTESVRALDADGRALSTRTSPDQKRKMVRGDEMKWD